jgi:amino acid transporter
MAVVGITQFFMGLSLVCDSPSLLPYLEFLTDFPFKLVAASRQSWAFSRDGALPFSSFFRPVSGRIRFQPVRTIWGCVAAAIILGLLCLINNAAANALFSLGVAANDLAWAMPIFCRIVWGQDNFKPGAFYTGRFSTAIAVIALCYLAFSITLSMFPTLGPSPSRESSQSIWKLWRPCYFCCLIARSSRIKYVLTPLIPQ